MTKNGPEIDQNSTIKLTQNWPQMYQKLTKNRSKIGHKLTQNELKMYQNSVKYVPKIDQKLTKN